MNKIFSKKIILITSFALLFFTNSAYAITPTTASVLTLSDLQAVQITALSGTVLFAVDVVQNKGIANQNPDTLPIYAYYNGAVGWNSPCANYADLGAVPSETCGPGTNVVLPTVQSGFHIRIYDTSSPGCYNNFADPAIGCASQNYLDIVYGSGSSGSGEVVGGGATTTPAELQYVNVGLILIASILGFGLLRVLFI